MEIAERSLMDEFFRSNDCKLGLQINITEFVLQIEIYNQMTGKSFACF